MRPLENPRVARARSQRLRPRFPPVLFTGGTIRTLDPAAPVVGQLAVRGPWVVDDDKAGAGVIELGERCVLPGFTDSHVHFPTWSLGLRQARLEGARSLEEALDRVVAAREQRARRAAGCAGSAGARATGPRRPRARRSTGPCPTCRSR